MVNPYQSPSGPGGGNGNQGPPGQTLLVTCLALLAAVLGTPYLFHFIAPVIRELVHQAYGSPALADFMYFVSFALSGVVIFALCRMALWYALSAVVAFGALRFAGMAA